jgi:hypothetical protein
MVEGVQQLDDVAVVTLGQDIDLHHVILQLLLSLRLNDFGCSQRSSLLILGLEDKTSQHLHNTKKKMGRRLSCDGG